MVKVRQGKILSRITKISILLWIGCIIGVFAILGYVVGVRGEMFDKAPNVFAFLLLGLIFLGCLAFLIGLVTFTAETLIKKSQKRQNILLFLIKIFFALVILPIYLLIYILKPLEVIRKIKQAGIKGLFKALYPKQVFVKIVALLFVGFVVLPIWIGGYVVVGVLGASQLGYVTQPILIGGTGSMYPTFPKGHGKTLQAQAKEVVGASGMLPYPNGLVFFGRRILGHQVGRGDIVVVENDTVREYNKKLLSESSGWVKRVVAIAGDNVELKDGIVYLNSNALKEPYIAKARSTFGETFLKECSKVTVPENSVFIMGDNRKGSGDSREVGFFSINDIKYVLPLKSQKGDLIKYWRDTSKDFDESSKIELDKEKYIELLNEKRKEANVRPLKYQPKLELSAGKRGEVILKYDDLSYEATRSGYTQLKAMNDVGYSNITYGEAPTFGYYEAEELIENQFEFPETKKFLLNKDYQEIGISEIEGSLNKCPAQAIVQHFAGYVPPNYNLEDLEGWKKTLLNLREILPSWNTIKDYSLTYNNNKKDADRLLEIINYRIGMIEKIVYKMENKQWLNNEENAYIRQELMLFNEQESIAKKLNGFRWQH